MPGSALSTPTAPRRFTGIRSGFGLQGQFGKQGARGDDPDKILRGLGCENGLQLGQSDAAVAGDGLVEPDACMGIQSYAAVYNPHRCLRRLKGGIGVHCRGPDLQFGGEIPDLDKKRGAAAFKIEAKGKIECKFS